MKFNELITSTSILIERIGNIFVKGVTSNIHKLYTRIVDAPTENNGALGLSSNNTRRSNNYFQGNLGYLCLKCTLWQIYFFINTCSRTIIPNCDTWWYGHWSMLTQTMACCLTVSSYYIKNVDLELLTSIQKHGGRIMCTSLWLLVWFRYLMRLRYHIWLVFTEHIRP